MIKTYLENLLKLGLNDSQASYYRWISAEGRFFDIASMDNQATENAFQAVMPELKRCFNNSLIVSLVLELDYVEGFYLTNGLVLEHAWNCSQEKNLIDVTSKLLKVNDIDEYFGVLIPVSFVAEYLKTSQAITLLKYYYLTTIQNDKRFNLNH